MISACSPATSLEVVGGGRGDPTGHAGARIACAVLTAGQ
jgi:Cu/Zn superoxide dismutase